MKNLNIFCHIPRENWVVDRLGEEYSKYSRHNISHVEINENTDIIWLFAGWCWNHINPKILENFYTVCTEHHIVKSKFEKEKKSSFLKRDPFINHYLTYTEETKSFISRYTDKPITIIPHWINENLWSRYDKNSVRQELNIPDNKYVISSFQRDTEGFDLKTPKLEKGPDIFVEKVCQINTFKRVHVLLGGWRRQYIIKRLKELNIEYTYIELPEIDMINKMYCASDLYLMSSREEGGPQSIFEASYLEIPILSTFAGQSRKILDKNCLYSIKEEIDNKKLKKAIECVKSNKKSVELFEVKNHMFAYDKFFDEVI